MNILKVKIDKFTKSQLRDYISSGFSASGKIKVYKINTEFIVRAQGDKKFFDVLNLSDKNIVDGRGIMWAARYLTLPIAKNAILRRLQAVWQMVYSGALIVFKPKFISYPISEAIPGIEAFRIMMQVASDEGASVFLFGGTQANLDMATKNLIKEFPNLIIAGSLNGYDYKTDNKIDPVAEINKTDARLLIVALGSPRQEFWIDENIDKLKNVRIAVGEGGTLDRIANPAQKAPRFINKIGLEWLWRTLLNRKKPDSENRLVKLWNSVPVFIYQVVKWKIKNGQTKI